MDEIKPVNSKGEPYKVQVDEKELASRIDPLSFDVLRKAATYAVLGDELFHKYFKVENPNRQLLKELQDAGVAFFVCGQTMIKRNMEEEELMPGTKIASSGLTTISTLQLQGYTMIKF